MYEFTERAAAALEFAKDFAIEHNYSYIGTEHILYGLVKDGEHKVRKHLPTIKNAAENGAPSCVQKRRFQTGNKGGG